MDHYEESEHGEGPMQEGYGDAHSWPHYCPEDLKTSLRKLSLKVKWWNDGVSSLDSVETCAGLLSMIECPGFQELWA